MSDPETILFYASVATLSLLLCRFSEKSGKPGGLFLAILVLSLAAGFRDYSVGIDTSRYKNGVEYFFQYGRQYWEVVFSYGYGYFTSFILHIWNNYSFLLFIQALITNGLIIARLWEFRKEASITFMVFVYLCTIYFLTLNIICQYIAVAIVFFSTRYLDRGKYVLFILGVVLATCIHNSAIIALLMLAPSMFRFKGATTGKKFVQTVGCIVFTISVLIACQFLMSRYSGYLGRSEGISLGAMPFAQIGVLVLALLITGYFSNRKGDEGIRNSLNRGAPDAVLFYSFSILLTLAAYLVDPAGRISYYFLPYGTLCYGAIAHRSRQSKSCFFVSMGLVVWFLIYVVYTCFLQDSGGIVPYSFIWMT